MLLFSSKKFTGILNTKLWIAPILAIVGAFLSYNTVAAADPNLPIKDSSYAAKFVSQSVFDPITIEAGATKEVTITFKNAGTATWSDKGGRHISAYTVEPKYRESVFKGSNWISAKQTGVISGIIKPGQNSALKLQLKAPTEEGTYTERFQLAAENTTWVKGGYFFLVIKVIPKSGTVTPPTPPATPPTPPSVPPQTTSTNPNAYKANRFIQSVKSIEAKGGDPIKLVIGFQNVGTASWKKIKLVSAVPTALAGRSLSFADKTWQSSSLIFEKANEIAPEKALRETVYFRAPRTKGNYDATFTLYADDQEIGQANIKVAVTDNAPLNYKEPFFEETPEEDKGDEFVKPSEPRSEDEPRIRVGIDVNELIALHFVSYEDDYMVYAGSREKGMLAKLKIGELRYSGGIYSFKGGGLQFSTEDFIRLVPKNDPHAVHQIMNLKRAMSWVGPGDFNEYRGIMEYRVGAIDGKKYAVNDLLFEDYVKGISEFGKADEVEFIKANIVAARTYAYVSLGKYSFFDVLSSTYDQLYLGKKVEDYMPNAKAAAEETRGMMVTYKDQVVITPYFGNSNGHTRSWTDVWGGSPKPWLVPVETDYDAGKKQYGHGVGMSQRDANLRAKNEGLKWHQLLKYYYTDTSIAWMYR